MKDLDRTNRVLEEAKHILSEINNRSEPVSTDEGIGMATIRAAIVALNHVEGDFKVEMFLLLEYTVAMMQKEMTEVH